MRNLCRQVQSTDAAVPGPPFNPLLARFYHPIVNYLNPHHRHPPSWFIHISHPWRVQHVNGSEIYQTLYSPKASSEVFGFLRCGKAMRAEKLGK